VADELKKTTGIDVRLEDGAHGEFKVLVDGRTIAEKAAELPPVEQVVSAVQAAA